MASSGLAASLMAFFHAIWAPFGAFFGWMGHQADALGTWLSSYGDRFVEFCNAYFYPVLHPVFSTINTVLNPIYQPWATICAVGFFLGTMIWVGVFLHEPYVNHGRPKKAWWMDLRLWTVFSMLPHVFVYFYFT